MHPQPRSLSRIARLANRLLVMGAAATLVSGSMTLAPVALNAGGAARAGDRHGDGCELDSSGGIKHVIYLQFDNTHFLRDDPNVPSDLEQMPTLLNFIRNNGTLMTNDHTVLISHTAGGILSSLTGVYPDRHGQAVSNSFRYFKPDGTTNSGVSFAYWTAPVFTPPGGGNAPPFDTTYNMITESGANAPAPWVPFTRAGCSFGAFATANVVLENTAIDIPTVFGDPSPEADEVRADPAQGFADFVGVAVHCAKGDRLCSTANHGRPDPLPNEPGGYSGYKGLFGAKYVAPAISPSGPMKDLDGNVIRDATGHIGFPGFDGDFPTNTLAYIASMQEAGIPITFGYISDAHDDHGVSGERHISYGPGQQGYVDQLKRYDAAFAKFFDRLAKSGINKSNTLFVFTVEEGDHFVGSQPAPAGCNGVTTPCTYTAVSEINGNLRGLLESQQGITTPFTVHSDMAPTVYLTGNPGRTDPIVREFERAVGKLTAVSPYTGLTDQLTVALADPVEMRALHMITGDPARTPTFTMFADPDYFLFASSATCGMPTPSCVFIPPPSNFTFAWNHGSIEPEIAATWLGVVGPGIRKAGQDDSTWIDHTDVRPTILSLLGLRDKYVPDGRVIIELLRQSAIPEGVRENRSTWLQLAATYKQLNAPFGTFSLATLRRSTVGMKSGSTSDDSTYAAIAAQITGWTDQRNAIAAQMRDMLTKSAFSDRPINKRGARALIAQGQALIDEVVAASP
jgi:hypothetical protein